MLSSVRSVFAFTFFPQEKEEELEMNTVRSILHVLVFLEAAHNYRY
jgi:hypothetical protein